eukprot:3063422-Pyramimonas_sp.AAC.1
MTSVTYKAFLLSSQSASRADMIRRSAKRGFRLADVFHSTAQHFVPPLHVRTFSSDTLEEDSRAHSLAEALRKAGKVKVLDLTQSSDLTCMNLMCEKVGDPCICRLSRVLERTPNVEVVSLAKNRLEQLPDALWTLKELRSLNLSDNSLRDLSTQIAQLAKLRHLNLSGNSGLQMPSTLPEGLEDIV